MMSQFISLEIEGAPNRMIEGAPNRMYIGTMIKFHVPFQISMECFVLFDLGEIWETPWYNTRTTGQKNHQQRLKNHQQRLSQLGYPR